MTADATRIICVGNRLQPSDAAGPRVHDVLADRDLPADTGLVDGGLAGLDLLRHLDGCRRAIFVDAVVIDDLEPGAYRLDPKAVAATATPTFDHAAGIPYLLNLLPALYGQQAPHIDFVGVQGEPDEALVADAAKLVLELVAAVESGDLGIDQQGAGAAS